MRKGHGHMCTARAKQRPSTFQAASRLRRETVVVRSTSQPSLQVLAQSLYVALGRLPNLSEPSC